MGLYLFGSFAMKEAAPLLTPVVVVVGVETTPKWLTGRLDNDEDGDEGVDSVTYIGSDGEFLTMTIGRVDADWLCIPPARLVYVGRGVRGEATASAFELFWAPKMISVSCLSLKSCRGPMSRR